MAEYVHQTLEEMIPELEEMTELGLFTNKETKIILKNRESLEYRLRQLTKTKASYLNYIDYEMKLLELLKIRRKKITTDSNKREIEKSIADRIHQLYRLATTRFQEDVSIWTRHIEFSKAMKEKAYVTRLYDRVLKIHGHNEGLWVESAQWESSQSGNSNQELAREILLKAQRVNPESEIILLEIFRMELELAKLILKRKFILGITDMEILKEANGAGEDKIAELKLAEIIYTKGVELFPGNAEFHLKLLNICCRYKIARKLQDVIIADLRRLHPQNPSAWNGLAWIHLNMFKKISPDQRNEAVQKCLDVYAEAVEIIPTESMWSYCLRAYMTILDMKGIKAEYRQQTLKAALANFQKALELRTLSEELYIRLMSLLEQLNLPEDAAMVSEYGTQQHPSSTPIWQARLRAMAERQEQDDVISAAMRAALKHIPEESSWPLWQFMLTLYAARNSSCLEKLMEQACRCTARQVCCPAKEWSLSWTFRHAGIKSARVAYGRMKTMRPISVQFFRIYIQAECSQSEPNLKLIRSGFEEALLEFGLNEPDVWLNYLEMEKKVAKSAAMSGVIQQRALNGLDPHLKESFIRKQIMMCLTE